MAQPTESDLQAGIRQVSEGDLEVAITTLDRAILAFSAQPSAHTKELSEAHLYKGVALVGLLREEPAKESFREALRYDPPLRLRKGQFPDRVVRVFEAARTGKEDSVMQRPSGTAKKAGLGAGAIAAIAGGAIAVAGGAAAVASGGGTPTPSPTPAPTPDPSRQVVPTSRLGPIDITFLSADPPPGSTISGCGNTPAGCSGRLRMRFSVRSPLPARGLFLGVALRTAGRACVTGRQGGFTGVGNFDLVANEPFVIEIGFTIVDTGCNTPVTIDEMVANMNRGTSGLSSDSEQGWSLSYRFVQ
jgi:hypothetical protein